MRAAKIDSNQNEIVEALRKIGCSVQILSSVGRGCPDILVGVPCGSFGLNIAMEIKDGNKPLSAQKLTPDQVKWHNDWIGHKVVVNSPESAIQATVYYRRWAKNDDDF